MGDQHLLANRQLAAPANYRQKLTPELINSLCLVSFLKASHMKYLDFL